MENDDVKDDVMEDVTEDVTGERRAQMGERTNIFDDGLHRVQSAWSSVEIEFESLQKAVEKRRKQFEKEAQKQVKRLRKTDLAKRIESLRGDATRQLESNVESALTMFSVASSTELKRLERRVTQLTRKLNAIEKSRANSVESQPDAVHAKPKATTESGRRGNGKAETQQATA